MATRRDLRGDLVACVALPSTEHNVSHPERRMLQRPISRAAKRGFDVAFSVMVLIWLLPFLIIIAVALFVESGGPVIFRQRRGGCGARLFTIYKFRTMRVLEDGPDVVQATLNDPRVTKLGAFLRRTSLDELPQLWNVVVGDMSIVGPRPHAAAHDCLYEKVIPSYRNRYVVKPGITGWAQVQGLRGETSQVEAMSARVTADLWYIDNWSFWLDLRIVVKTAKELLFAKCAY